MRISARITGAAVAAVSAALLLSGCGSSDDGDDGGDGGKKKSSAGQDSTGGNGGDDGSTDGSVLDPADLEGGWSKGEITAQDHAILVFVGQGRATSITTKDASCHGTYAPGGEGVTMEMKCTKGSGFETGTVKGLEGKELTVAWGSGETDTFTRTVGPSGQPDIGTKIPDLPDAPDVPELP